LTYAASKNGLSRAFALPVADKAKAQRVQRSAGDEGIRAKDIRRVPQTTEGAGPYKA